MGAPGNLAWLSVDQFSQRISYTAGGLPEYIGECFPKNQHRTGEDVWRINKITYDGSDNALSILWAERTNKFQFSWDARAGYTYG
jgi:hypothetical protein